MRILIDIGHPAHVHLFRNLYKELISKGHFVIVTVKSFLRPDESPTTETTVVIVDPFP